MKHLWIVAALIIYFELGQPTLVSADDQAKVPEIASEKAVDYFETHIRPVLVEKCYECHAANTEINGGLALDSRPGWQRGGDTGDAIKPGSPADSLLIKALEYSDPKLQMPPDGALPPETVAHFRQWITDGAVDPRVTEPTAKPKQTGLPVDRAVEHWAYRPVTDPIVPIQFSASTAIDAFLAAKHEEAGVETSELASDRVILRRLMFDLHGLPPSETELQSYADDDSPDKYGRIVDRLLASPRFGERMARHWMDVARYAESVTLRGFVLPQAWRYRDYLITAFNEDRPFDQFIQEQIAGDLLTNDNRERRSEQIVATTFLAMGNTNLEEQVKEQLEMDYVDEQLDVIGRVFMGQTVGCARCHDHKFDPIPTRDYYAMAGIFKASKAMEHENVSKWIERPLPLTDSQSVRFTSLEKELKETKAKEASTEKLVNGAPGKSTKAPVDLSKLSGIVIDDSQAQRVGEWKESTTVTPFVGTGYIHDLSESSVAKSLTFEPKRLPPGNYAVRMSYTPGQNRSTRSVVRVFSADGEKVVTINQREAPTIDGLWISLGDYRFEKDGQAFVLVSNEGADGHVVADAVQFLPADDATRVAAKETGATATSDGKSAVSGTDSKKDPALEKELKRLKSERTKLEAALALRPAALSIEEQLPAKDLPVHIRGSVHNLGAEVPRGFLQCAEFNQRPTFPPETSGRREFAQWLSDKRHPLTARVLVNRLWLWVFGAGLVRTVDNFGTTGDLPSQPELLDHLASDFMRHDWSAQLAIRNMLLSSAYRRSVEPSERTQELDPENKLFSHAVRKRIDVESLRDGLLQISGELSFPGAQPTLKAGVKEDYRYEFAPNLRAVYQPVLRNSLPELYEAFDFPNSSVSIGQRENSVVSPQALALLNSSWVHERATAASQRLERELGLLKEASLSTAQWTDVIKQVFERCLGRSPTQLETYTTQTLIAELDSKQTVRSEIVTRIVHGLMASLDFRYLE